jgi:hypothetical protein
MFQSQKMTNNPFGNQALSPFLSSIGSSVTLQKSLPFLQITSVSAIIEDNADSFMNIK